MNEIKSSDMITKDTWFLKEAKKQQTMGGFDMSMTTPGGPNSPPSNLHG